MACPDSWRSGCLIHRRSTEGKLGGTLSDRDTQRSALNAAREDASVSDADLRLMVDAIGDYAIFVLDTEGQVRSWNRGEHIGFAKITRDLSDKRRISKLEDEGRRIATFLAMLGNDIRKPLAPMADALAILEHAGAQPEHRTLARAVISRIEFKEPVQVG